MKWVVVLLMSLLSVAAMAETPDAGLSSELSAIQHRWAEIQYRLPADDREKAFEELAEQTEAFVEHYPQRAESHIWRAIVLSTWAGEKGGLGALGLVRDARKHLEQAIRIDDTALDGSAYTSLGSLYYQVPGWPIAFGDDDKARRYLQKALAINPDGIDPNFFFADYLIRQGETARARQYLQRALSAPDRPNRPLADEGRRQEIRDRMSRLAAGR